MKISIREALFSGEEVDDWEPPTSDWVIIKDFNDREWDANWASAHGLTYADDIKTSNYTFLYDGMKQEVCIRWDEPGYEVSPDASGSGRVYYHEESKMYFNLEEYEFSQVLKSDESKLQIVLDFIEASPRLQIKDYNIKGIL